VLGASDEPTDGEWDREPPLDWMASRGAGGGSLVHAVAMETTIKYTFIFIVNVLVVEFQMSHHYNLEILQCNICKESKTFKSIQNILVFGLY